MIATPAEAQGLGSTSPPLPAISIGFVRHAFGAWTARIADGGFTSATGRNLRWLPHDTDSALAAAMASGKADIGIMGAGVAATLAARGIDLRIFYVLGASAASEELVLSTARGIPPSEPKSLQGKVIAVPFGSSSHYRLLEGLKRWQMSPSALRIVNLQTPQIAEAWRRNEIDGAVVAEPLLTALSERGQPIPLPSASQHPGLMVAATTGDFAIRHMVFMSRFVDVVARADIALGSNPSTPDEDTNDVRSITFITGLSASTVVKGLARYRPPALEEQASSSWLSGGSQSGLANELRIVIDIWRSSGRLTGADPDYSVLIIPEPVRLALTYR